MIRGLVLGAAAALLTGCVAQGQISKKSPGDSNQGTVTDRSDLKPGNQQRSLFGQYLAGRVARRSRDTAAALEFYEATLKRDPENSKLTRRAFSLNLIEGRLDRALILAERLVKNDANSQLARIVLAARDFRNGAWTLARERIGGGSGGGIVNFFAPVISGWAYIGEDRPTEAFRSLEKAKKKGGFDGFHGFHAGMMSEAADRPADALRFYQDAIKKRGRDVSRVMLAYTALLAHTDQRERAAKALDGYLAKVPNSPIIINARERLQAGATIRTPAGGPSEGFAEALFYVASSHARRRRNDAARTYAHLALYLRPDLASAHILLGELLEAKKRRGDANKVYARVDGQSAYKWEARIRIAHNLGKMKRSEEATALLLRMAEERPDDTDALVTAGDLQRSEKKYAKASELYSRALKRVKKVEPSHWVLFYTRGITFERSDKWPAAEKDFLKALELKPDQPAVLNYLGYSWVEKGKNLIKARQMIEKAVKQRPNDGYIVDSLGWALYRLGEYDEAVKHLEHAVELRPQDPILNDHLGDAYWRAGRLEEARFQWNHALVFKPKEEVRRKIELKLRNGPGKE